MNALTTSSTIMVTCAKGVAPVLATELEALGYPPVDIKTLGVTTKGTFQDTIKLNLQLRTGLRVLYHLQDFRAANADDLYRELAALPWETVMDANGYLCITSSVINPTIKDFRFANVRCKDAIVDRLQRVKGRRPDSGPDRTKTVLFLYWYQNRAAIYLDTSGEPLSKRGYRKIPGLAPMQEALAAAVLSATRWDGKTPLVNPMCGSGTVAIEAAMMALNRAPGLLRHNFGFMHTLAYPEHVYQEWRKALRDAAEKTLPSRIVLSDYDPKAISAAKQNAKTAGVDHLLEFETCDFRKTTIPEERGVVILNPGYGLRLSDQKALETVYSAIGDFFKQHCTGYTGYVFTGNLKLAKRIGLRTSRRQIFYNGKIESRLLEYELYEGSR